MNETLPLRDLRIVISKSARRLELFDGEQLVMEFAISLGSTPEGDKTVEGDGRTPEGEFYVVTKNEKSKFHLSLGLSYPNREDADRGLAKKIILPEEHAAILDAIESGAMPPQKTALGGEIYIHGGGCDSDWTEGCIALENDQMSYLFSVVEKGTPVIIRP